MAERTGISWADITFNPWMGCQKVSPACDFCYAEELCGQRLGVEWGPHAERRRTAASTWKKLAAYNRHPEKYLPEGLEGTKPFVFGGSLCDVFDNQVPVEWLADYLRAIEAAPNLVFLLLTKRPQLIIKRVRATGFERLPANVALGTTCEDQTRADQNLPHLLLAGQTLGALFLFGSFEPLLGPVNIEKIVLRRDGALPTDLSNRLGDYIRPLAGNFRDSPRLAWVIGGGESGRHARPSEQEWFRSLRDQTLGAGAIYHHKQNGGRGPDKGGKMLDGRLLQDRPRVPA